MEKKQINERIWHSMILLKSTDFLADTVRKRAQQQISVKTRTAIRQSIVLPLTHIFL